MWLYFHLIFLTEKNSAQIKKILKIINKIQQTSEKFKSK
jgi:hypothetical protein